MIEKEKEQTTYQQQFKITTTKKDINDLTKNLPNLLNSQRPHQHPNLVNKLDDYKLLIKTESYDFVYLIETWLNENISEDDLKHPSYQIVRSDRGSRGGGLIIC